MHGEHGEKALGVLLKSMRPRLAEGEFVFCTMPPEAAMPSGLEPVCTFRESEGLSLILRRDRAAAAGLRHQYVCRMITLSVHSALDAVGFLAAITTRLAEAGISVNPVSAYHHDHLFVPADRAQDAMRILADLSEIGC